MSEENVDVQASEGSASPESSPSFYYSDNVPGSGDVPDWFKVDKYKSVSEQARAYGELEKKYGELTNKYKGISGAPEKYEIRAPEALGLEFEFDGEDPIVQRATEWAKENNLPQETFEGLMGVYAELEMARDHAFEEFRNSERSKIENFDSRNKNINDFLQANNLGALADVITNAEQMEQFEALLNMTGKASIDVDSEGANVPTEEEIHKLMFEKDEFGRQIYNYDKERQARVRKMWAARVGTGDYHQRIG